MTFDPKEARTLVERLRTKAPYKSALQIACEENISQKGEQTVGEMTVFLGQGDYPTIQQLADVMTRDANQAADTIAALLAENERLQMQIKSLDHALDFIVLDAAWTPKHPACESIITRINALRKGADND